MARDGESRYFLNNLVGIVRDGRLVRAWGSQRDITARKEIESALRASEERYRALVTASTSLVWTSDAEGRFAEPQRLLGALHRATVGRAPGDRAGSTRCTPTTGKPCGAPGSGVGQPSAVQSTPVSGRWSGTRYRHVVGRAVPVLEADGSVREWIGAVTDVEDRWLAEERLRQAERMETVGRSPAGSRTKPTIRCR